MHEITIDVYKHFLLYFNNSGRDSFAKEFTKAFNVTNKELMELSDDEAKLYVFNKYLLN